MPAALAAVGQPEIVNIGGRQVVVSTIEKMHYGVDLATGKEAWPPLDLGFEPDSLRKSSIPRAMANRSPCTFPAARETPMFKREFP